MIKAGIIGATGYAGAELVRILTNHKEAEVIWYGSKSYVGKPYAEVLANFFQLTQDVCKDDSLEELAESADVIFTATPQGFLSSVLTEALLSRTKVIDLSADYRIQDIATYETWYGIKHHSPQLTKEAIYGLTELHREEIRGARLIANPGCYPTCSVLCMYPLLKENLLDPNTIVIDAKSGTSGAGRGAKVGNLFCEVNENIKAYGVGTHRHTPEIEDQLSEAAGSTVTVSFTPHLVPMDRGILVTAYACLRKKQDGSLPTDEEIRAIYRRYYQNETFIRLLEKDVCPETKRVRGSNYTDINFKIDKRVGRIVMMGALDNIVKGAAGQAVQNMNVLFGCKEDEGLSLVPMFA